MPSRFGLKARLPRSGPVVLARRQVTQTLSNLEVATQAESAFSQFKAESEHVRSQQTAKSVQNRLITGQCILLLSLACVASGDRSIVHRSPSFVGAHTKEETHAACTSLSLTRRSICLHTAKRTSTSKYGASSLFKLLLGSEAAGCLRGRGTRALGSEAADGWRTQR